MVMKSLCTPSFGSLHQKTSDMLQKNLSKSILQIIGRRPPLIRAAGKATLIADDVKILCSRDAHHKDDILRFSQYIKETLRGRAPGLGVCPSCLSKRQTKDSLEAEKKRKRDEKEQVVSWAGLGRGISGLRLLTVLGFDLIWREDESQLL